MWIRGCFLSYNKNKVIRDMCTIHLTMNDSLVEALRPTFKNKEAMREWLQEQTNRLLTEMLDRQQLAESDSHPVEIQEHTEWVRSMAKYRRVLPVDAKQEMLDSLDERYQ